jgi:hypothetical protein
MTRNLIERYIQANRRFAAWNLNAYLPWARRHEPHSFAIGPLVLGSGFLLVWLVSWLGFGYGPLKVVFYFLVPAAALFVVSISTGLWLRRQRQRGKPDQIE